MAGILLITIFPFLFYRVDDLLKIIKWILKPKLFAYLYEQIAYLPHVRVYTVKKKGPRGVRFEGCYSPGSVMATHKGVELTYWGVGRLC